MPGRGWNEDGFRSDRGRFAGGSAESAGSGPKSGIADAGLGDGGLNGMGAKGGLVAKAIVARVSIVELDLP